MCQARPASASFAAILSLALPLGGASCHARSSSSVTPDPSGRPVSSASSAVSSAAGAYPWIPDQGDGTYRNPVLLADYSDPDVLRVGELYYLTSSSFHLTPGLPILRSPDLVSWTIVGHALENLPDRRYEEVQHGAGVWAPSLRQHDGTFYIFAPLPDEGIYVLSARKPEGPWSAPQLIVPGKGLIDPCPLWDDDGKAYLVHAYARSRAGIKDRLRVVPMAPDASRLLGEGRIVFHDPARHPTLEGPKFYKIDGWYYILAPAGGVVNGWQVALRAREVYGPYEDRVVLEQGKTSINGPHQGALVDTASGSWWFVHFQDAGVYGRIVHLNPVTWEGGWPLLGTPGEGGKREPVLAFRKPIDARLPPEIPSTSDEFDPPKGLGPDASGARLGLQWQWYANHDDAWFSLDARPGYLRLFPRVMSKLDFARAPNLLLQKLPARSFVAETSVEVGDPTAKSRAGLVVVGESHAALAVQRTKDGQILVFFVDNEIVGEHRISDGPVRLFVSMADGGGCRFFYQGAGDADVTLAGSFQARAGRWIGANVGLFAIGEPATTPGTHADFAYFRFHPPAVEGDNARLDYPR